MAKDNRLKKGAAVTFDENLLIGKLSGLSRSAASAPATAPPVEPAAPEKDTAAPQQPSPETVAGAAPQQAAGKREGEKTDTVMAPTPAAPVANTTAEVATAGLPVKKIKSGKTWEYGRFLVATDTKKKAHVYITDENHKKIKQVLSLFGNKLAIADYLDNLLTQHWEQYDPEIQERMQQMFSKK